MLWGRVVHNKFADEFADLIFRWLGVEECLEGGGGVEGLRAYFVSNNIAEV